MKRNELKWFLPRPQLSESSGAYARKKFKNWGGDRFSGHFFSCNTIRLMLNFAKVGGGCPSDPPVPGPDAHSKEPLPFRGFFWTPWNLEILPADFQTSNDVRSPSTWSTFLKRKFPKFEIGANRGQKHQISVVNLIHYNRHAYEPILMQLAAIDSQWIRLSHSYQKLKKKTGGCRLAFLGVDLHIKALLKHAFCSNGS